MEAWGIFGKYIGRSEANARNGRDRIWTARMKYLGFWQRLGIVLTVLVTFLLPTMHWWDVARTSDENMSQFRDECLERYPAERGAFLEERAVCNDAFLNRYKPDYVDYMKEGIPVVFAFCMILWGLAYAIYLVVRWVLAGRKTGV